MAEIRMFAGNFNPRSWLYCDGSTQSIANNSALFSLLGTTYGGNGQTTFNLPDFRGRIAVGAQFSQGPGLPAVQLGEMAGAQSVTLLTTNLPAHNHPITGTVNQTAINATAGLTDNPVNARLGGAAGFYTTVGSPMVNMIPFVSTLAVGATGSSQPVGTMLPYLGMNYIICAEGIYPSRN